ncbi:MAG: (Fe-S)-binding protein [Candidatus Brocadiia bacterium]
MSVVTTFPGPEEAEKVRTALDEAGLSYEIISPEPGYRKVGDLAVAMDAKTRTALIEALGDVVCAGWVDYRPAQIEVPTQEPPQFDKDVFGRTAIMVLAPCVADETKIRLIAHISGDMTEVFPYLNAEMKGASYSVDGPTFTFMDGYRMVSVYPHRIAVAKADEIVDAWRVLEELRCRANQTWARRNEIEPSYERRERPPALEVYKRLPGTNCGRCGEQTCLAFAVRVHAGEVSVRECMPVFDGEYEDMREALVEVVQALGVDGGDVADDS